MINTGNIIVEYSGMGSPASNNNECRTFAT
jgi:hypothetical protein